MSMVDRQELLRESLDRELGTAVLFVDSIPSDAGITLDATGIVLCQESQLALMADALTDPDFELFVRAVAQWAVFARQFFADGLFPELAMELGRRAMREKFPNASVILDAVFLL